MYYSLKQHSLIIRNEKEKRKKITCSVDPSLNMAITMTPKIILWAKGRFDPDSTGKEFWDLTHNQWVKAEDLYDLYIKESFKK